MQRKVYFLSGLLLLLCTHTTMGNKLDSLHDALQRSPKTQRAAIYNELSYEYRSINADSSIVFAQLAYDLADNDNELSEKAKSIHYLGIAYRIQSDYARANVLFSEAIDLYKLLSDRKGESDVINSIGVSYYYLGAYEAALNSYLSALKMKEAIEDTKGMANTCNNIGLVLEIQNKLDEALIYHTQSLKIEQSLMNKAGMATSYHNIGIIYTTKVELSRALAYFDSAMYLRVMLSDVKGIASTLGNIGEVYIKQGYYENARSNYKRALAMYQQIKNIEGIASTYHGLGMVDYHQKDFEGALGYFFRSLESAREGSYKKIMADNLNKIAESYLILKDYQNAYAYQEEFHRLNDSVFSESASHKLNEMQMQYELKKREREIELKDKEIQIRDLQLGQSRIYTYAAVVGIILLGLLGLMLYLRGRFERRVHRTLKQKNIEIIKQKEEIAKQRDEIVKSHHKLSEAQDIIFMQNERLKGVNYDLEKMVKKRTSELEESYKELLDVNAELDTFLYKASHDIKGPLLRMKGLASLGQLEVKDETGRDYFKKLDEVVHYMDSILSRLLSYNKVKHHIPEIETVVLDELIRKVITEVEVSEKAPFGSVALLIEVGYIKADRFLLKEILYNLIENAHHYTREKKPPEIMILVSQMGDQINLQVKDKGIGISSNIAEKVFDIFFRGTQRSQGSGLGLYIARMSAQKLSGAINIVDDDEWTIFELILPIAQ